MVEDIATAKGKDIPIDENEFLISADTLIGNGSLIYGKPQNKAEHLERLKALNNSTHSVMTGVCLRYQGKQKTFSVESKVNFGTHSNGKYIYKCKFLNPDTTASDLRKLHLFDMYRVSHFCFCY